jgi:putative methyltransferase (TIGR04325 family)
MKNILKKILPTSIKNSFRRIFVQEWAGDFINWQEAQKISTGYSEVNILEKVTQSLLKVKNGEAVYERDSVLFDKIQYSWPSLSALMWIAAINKGNLNVIDFGGSLGSSYFQNKFFLDSLDHVKWNIVEQESFVKKGKELFEDSTLKFFLSIQDSINLSAIPNVLLLSCVLPYLAEPYKILEEISNFSIPYVIIDNTPFNFESRDRICVQNVPASIYKASIPCWLLNYENVMKVVDKKYSIITEYENDSSIFINKKRLPYRGLLAKLKVSGV